MILNDKSNSKNRKWFDYFVESVFYFGILAKWIRCEDTTQIRSIKSEVIECMCVEKQVEHRVSN